MRKSILILMFLFVLQNSWPQPLPSKLKHDVIIDTDCGIDDFRAICLILANSKINVKAILTTDGNITPADGFEKVRALLGELKRTDIPVGKGEIIPGINPAWREFARSIVWGHVTEKNGSITGGSELLIKTLRASDNKITLLCLGPLTNIADAIKKDPGIISSIERILWYNDSPEPVKGFNYDSDRASADKLLGTSARVVIISNQYGEKATFGNELLEACRQSETPSALIMDRVLNQDVVTAKHGKTGLTLMDDLTAVYLTNPELFLIDTGKERISVRFNTGYNVQGVRAVMKDLIKGSYNTEPGIAFNRFPSEPSLYRYDIRPLIDTAIALHGPEEWKANVMTDEFHGHLGVFSIVGVKMGIRAREILNAGPDVLKVVSYAGTTPPYSCLNDGIQVSTGSTLGIGLIEVRKTRKPGPSADFTLGNRSIRITLKDEYLRQVEDDIREGVTKYGLSDDSYWQLIRQNALKYWLEWNRENIFDIKEITR